MPALAELEREAFSDPWTSEQLAEALSWTGAIAYLSEDDRGVTGYVLGRVVVDQAEILSIATTVRCRRQGVAQALLDAALARMIERGAAAAWLEVRMSNNAARLMYERVGFVAAGLRRGYYRQPPEDALVLRRDLNDVRVSES